MKGNTFIYQSRLQIYYKMADVNKNRKYLVHAKYRKHVSNDEHKTTLTHTPVALWTFTGELWNSTELAQRHYSRPGKDGQHGSSWRYTVHPGIFKQFKNSRITPQNVPDHPRSFQMTTVKLQFNLITVHPVHPGTEQEKTEVLV